MNIAVIGIGGVGGYFGGKLTQLLKDDKSLNIYFIARNHHLKEIQENGLILDSDDGEFICHPTKATDNIAELPILDLCLVCVKGYDLDKTMPLLKDKISDKTMILPLLNGVDVSERIRKTIEKGVLFPSCVYVGTHIEKPGKVTQRGGTRTIHFGNDPENSFVNPAIFDLFKKADIKYNWLDEPYTEIWSKFVFIAAYGLVTANFNKTIGEVVASDELSNCTKQIMHEISSIARRRGIALPESIENDSFSKGKNFPFEAKTSFQRDFEIIDKPDERDLFGGTIIRMGIESGVPTETTKEIYESIQKKKKDLA
jgi:2-dehydropantoate 2-reductase